MGHVAETVVGLEHNPQQPTVKTKIIKNCFISLKNLMFTKKLQSCLTTNKIMFCHEFESQMTRFRFFRSSDCWSLSHSTLTTIFTNLGVVVKFELEQFKLFSYFHPFEKWIINEIVNLFIISMKINKIKISAQYLKRKLISNFRRNFELKFLIE